MVRYILSIRHFLTLYSVNKTLFDSTESLTTHGAHLRGQGRYAAGLRGRVLQHNTRRLLSSQASLEVPRPAQVTSDVHPC